MSRLLMIGIDALDSRTLSHLMDRLPNFRKLTNSGSKIEFDGVFPPDSPTSWASIFTGLNPANHGIVLFSDPLGRVSTMISKDVDDSTIRGRTFWDMAGRLGKKVCILPHLLGYPPWNVNGIMVGRSGVDAQVKACPDALSQTYDLSKFAWKLDLFPGRNRDRYLEEAKLQLRNETGVGLELLRREDWDLFFVSFGELDPIQYSLWHYYDRGDPAYPGRTRWENAIPEAYEMFDEVLGMFLRAAGSRTATIVVSDHGIGTRPVRLVNINELLRRESLLSMKTNSEVPSRTTSMKKMIVQTIDKLELSNIAASVLKAFPGGKDWFLASPDINWSTSRAHLTDQSGIKNYPYGGLMINKEGLDDVTRNAIIHKIMNLLATLQDPATNREIVKWVLRREDLYQGEYLDRYPDIIFELREDFGAGASTLGSLYGESVSHRIAPGCHKQHNATILISPSSDLTLARSKMNLMDIAPTVLDLLELDWRNFAFDGTSIMDRASTKR